MVSIRAFDVMKDLLFASVRPLSKFNTNLHNKMSKIKYNPTSVIPETMPEIPNNIIYNLCARFLLNIPKQKLSDPYHVLFLCEEAYWFYIDYCINDYDNSQIIEIEHPCESELYRYKEQSINNSSSNLPMVSFHEITFLLLERCGYLKTILNTAANLEISFDNNSNRAQSPYNLLGKLIMHWKKYKKLLPVCGAIILDETRQYVLLVKTYEEKEENGAWMFPRGKIIRENEKDWQCAIREVFEETGLDISPYINKNSFLVLNEPDSKDKNYASHTSSIYPTPTKTIKLFIVSGVPKSVHFKPQTRCEISGIQWFDIRELYAHYQTRKLIKSMFPDHDVGTYKGNKFFQVDYFIRQLFRIMSSQHHSTLEGVKFDDNHHPLNGHKVSPLINSFNLQNNLYNEFDPKFVQNPHNQQLIMNPNLAANSNIKKTPRRIDDKRPSIIPALALESGPTHHIHTSSKHHIVHDDKVKSKPLNILPNLKSLTLSPISITNELLANFEPKTSHNNDFSPLPKHITINGITKPLTSTPLVQNRKSWDKISVHKKRTHLASEGCGQPKFENTNLLQNLAHSNSFSATNTSSQKPISLLTLFSDKNVDMNESNRENKVICVENIFKKLNQVPDLNLNTITTTNNNSKKDDNASQINSNSKGQISLKNRLIPSAPVNQTNGIKSSLSSRPNHTSLPRSIAKQLLFNPTHTSFATQPKNDTKHITKLITCKNDDVANNKPIFEGQWFKVLDLKTCLEDILNA